MLLPVVLLVGLLGEVAVVPLLITQGLNLSAIVAGFMGGTGILIVVGVALDLDDKIESQLLVRQYEGFVRGGEGPRPGGSGSTEKKPVSL